MAHKTGLGRGLASLIPQKISNEPSASLPEIPRREKTLAIYEVAVEKISPNPKQPRKVFLESELENLVASIKIHGILQPLVVTKIGGDAYELLAGERRLEAAKKAGFATVPVIVRTATEQQKLEIALIENIQRHNLNPVEEAMAYEQMINEFNLTQDETAKRVGKKRATVANMLRLLALPEEAKDALIAGKISEGHAKVLLGLPSVKDQLVFLEKILNFSLSVRDLESNVRKIKVRSHVRVKVKNPEIALLEEKLEEKLGTKVRIKTNKKGGEIDIEFYSPEDLQNIAAKIS